MPETRKYTRAGRRNIISVPDLLSQSGENALVCLPIPALEIARKLIRNRGYWRTTYALEYFDNHYSLPDDTDFHEILAMLDEFMEATTSMDCNDLITELNDIEQAINALGGSGGCGCGSGGGGATSPPADDTDTGDITAPGGTPPDGWPDWETYQIAKCDTATFIIQSVLDDVRWWQTVQIATLTLAALSAGMVSILSAFTLTAILAGLLALLAYEITHLEDVEEQLVDGFDDLVCAILAGTDAQTSMNNYISEMETQMAAKIADPIAEFLVQQLLGYWADPEFFNLLYADYDEYLGHSIPTGANCEDCGLACDKWQVSVGTWLGGLTFESEFNNSYQRVQIQFNHDPGDICDLPRCGPEWLFTTTSLIGHTPTTAGPDDFRVWQDIDCPRSDTAASGYYSDTPPIDIQLCGRNLSFISASQFTVTFRKDGTC